MAWDIWEEMRRMQEEMDRIFSDFFAQSPLMLGPGRAVAESEQRMPSMRKAFVDIQETDKDLIITAELPGMEKEDIDVNVMADRIEIRAEKKEEEKKEDREKGYAAYGRRFAGFYRSVPLPAAVNPDSVKATYKNGILEISLPKKEVSKTRSIKVE